VISELQTISTSTSLLLLALAMALPSAFALWRHTAQHMRLGLTAGLHANVLLFGAVGSAAYALAPGVERVRGIPESMVLVGWPFVIGYIAYVAYEFWSTRDEAPSARADSRADLSPSFIGVVLLAALVGYIGSGTDFSGSGVGTIFPVLKMFWYPAVAASVLVATKERVSSLVVLASAVGVQTAFALLSGWRSELLSVAGAILLGLVLRRRAWLWVSPVIVVVTVLLLLPFAQLKKTDYARVQADPIAAFEETAAMPIDERITLVTEIWAERVNFVREMAFINAALESSRIDVRGGDTYVEAMMQLVPRIFWPEKPSFNVSTNYYLARDVGLVGWADSDTSWGVSLFAEIVWNFRALHLLWAVPLIFLLGSQFDRTAARIRHKGVLWFVQTACFFFGAGIVGLVNALTFLLWSLLIGVGADRVLAMSVRRPFPNPAQRGAAPTGGH
jgi:hypothetical protein